MTDKTFTGNRAMDKQEGRCRHGILGQHRCRDCEHEDDKLMDITREYVHNWLCSPELEDVINSSVGRELERLIARTIEDVQEKAALDQPVSEPHGYLVYHTNGMIDFVEKYEEAYRDTATEIKPVYLRPDQPVSGDVEGLIETLVTTYGVALTTEAERFLQGNGIYNKETHVAVPKVLSEDQLQRTKNELAASSTGMSKAQIRIAHNIIWKSVKALTQQEEGDG